MRVGERYPSNPTMKAATSERKPIAGTKSRTRRMNNSLKSQVDGSVDGVIRVHMLIIKLVVRSPAITFATSFVLRSPTA